ncbi:hypothetical protein ACLOAV_010175 [Pseudogymnoascus australis]
MAKMCSISDATEVPFQQGPTLPHANNITTALWIIALCSILCCFRYLCMPRHQDQRNFLRLTLPSGDTVTVETTHYNDIFVSVTTGGTIKVKSIAIDRNDKESDLDNEEDDIDDYEEDDIHDEETIATTIAMTIKTIAISSSSIFVSSLQYCLFGLFIAAGGLFIAAGIEFGINSTEGIW